MMYWVIAAVLFIIALVVLDVLYKLRFFSSDEQDFNFIKAVLAVLCIIWPFTILSIVVVAVFFALCFLVNQLTGRISGAIVRKLSKKVIK